MLSYRLLLLLKLSAVLAYVAGATASFVATSPQERKRAVHAVASPALLLVWVSGYLLAQRLGVALSELWLLGGVVLSFMSLLALIVAAQHGQLRWFGAFALALLSVLSLMVFRPTWGSP